MNFENILFDSTEVVSRPMQPGSFIFFLLKALFSIQVMEFCFSLGIDNGIQSLKYFRPRT